MTTTAELRPPDEIDHANSASIGSVEPTGNWSAVVSLVFTVAAILIAELLPPSMLTPLARDLGITEGVAGQTISATAIAAMLASLGITRVTRGVDRRLVLLAFSLLLIVSSVMTGLAAGLASLMFARILLGIALGGFWALAASLAMRLVPKASIPRALSIVFGGVSVAMVAAAPLGSFLSNLIGWRCVFIAAAGLGVVGLLWQLLVLPKMSAEPPKESSGVWAVARRPGVFAAMLAMFCVFAANMSFFTYMRPFYETVTRLDVRALSGVLLCFGLANCVGTSLSHWALKRSLTVTLLMAPFVLAFAAAGLVLAGSVASATTALTAVWGFVFGTVPVGWSTWVTRNLGDDAENAGGLQVAVIQLANTAGAAVGGVIFDFRGPYGPIVIAGVLMVAATLMIAFWVRAPIDTAVPQ